MRVLVVEDFEVLAAAIGTGLRREGMAVDVVLDGDDALEHLAVTRYDVVVLDRDLPGTHGDEVCRRLVAGPSGSRVLMLTAASTVRERVAGLGLGADDYLPKPFDFAELVARVRALARRSAAPLPPFRLPRVTLRMQLALLYAGFLTFGAALLLVPILTIHQAVPEGADGRVIAGIQASTQAQEIRAVAILAGLVLLSLAAGWLVAGWFLRPLRTITATARDISASNLNRRLVPLALTGRNDEFKDLGETLDSLFERLEASFESQRRFVANASHELRTPLAAERTLLQVALADPGATAGTLRETCQQALVLGGQQERLIEALLTLASSERGVEQWEPFDLTRPRAGPLRRRSRARPGHRPRDRRRPQGWPHRHRPSRWWPRPRGELPLKQRPVLRIRFTSG
jgi:DNA-binding response OmpR family regulator